MYKLKLNKGRSYSSEQIKPTIVTAEKPFITINEKTLADALVSTGRFIFAEEIKPKDGKPGGGMDVEKMTEAQLDAYAKENGIDLAGAAKKSEKLALIQESLGAIDYSG